MRNLCDRVSALAAGVLVGAWYATTYPCELPDAEAAAKAAKDKANKKGKKAEQKTNTK